MILSIGLIMYKHILICLLSIFLIGFNVADAGVLSKIVKGAAIAQGGKLIAKQIAKKVIKNGVKDSTKPLLKNELKVGKYGDLTSKMRSENIEYHHIPSAKFMEQYGIKKSDGISMGVEKSRHSLTRTYKGGNKPILKKNESPREALARDIKDMKQIYRDNTLLNSEIKDNLKEVIKQNKEKFPNLFIKKKS